MLNWSRAVWIEPSNNGQIEEYEMTIPCNWVKGGKIYWPDHMNVTDSFNKHEEPKSSWHQFKLVKLKVKRGNALSFC